MQVVKAFDGELDASRRYIFAYLPHGMLPAGAGYVSFLPSWQRAFPGVEPIILHANVMAYVPVMRDLCGWIGACQVRCLLRMRWGAAEPG